MTEQSAGEATARTTPAIRELQAAREIAHAFLTAAAPVEVYRVALERVVPLVGAAFGCVFLRNESEEDRDLLRVVAAHNWPRPLAAYLGEMRVRIGNGPTGRAVAENRVVEVFDILADPELEDWWDAAREMDFASSVALPLVFRNDPAGAITFYFREGDRLCAADRSLLRLVADQLAATAEKAHLIEDLQRANRQLREQNIELEARFRQAEEARRLKGEMLANVSHELRTPLTAILGYTYLLREGHSGGLAGDQVNAVERIEGAAAALLAQINDLLDLTHLHLGRTPVQVEACDAVALVRAALSALSPPSAEVEVRTEVPPDSVPVVTDPVQVLRILQNLLSNAFKFTAAGSVTIRVSIASDEDEAESGMESAAPGAIRWEIRDTGIGIPIEDQEAIFDEFRQVDGSATRRYGGAGLGLALARGLARRLGGDITVSSAPGEGATFTLTLPVDPARPRAFEEGESRMSVRPQPTGQTS